MIKVAAMKPADRAKAVNAWRVELAYEKQDKIAAWGLQVSWLTPGSRKAQPAGIGEYQHGSTESSNPTSSKDTVRG
jgi:hypothetical protein